MTGIQVKSFITHKRGETDGDIQDSIAYDVDRGRYALSDGVTNSFLPKCLSDLLTQSYLEVENHSDFPPRSLPQQFQTQRDNYLEQLDAEQRMLQEMVEEEFKVGAATFVGLTVDGDEFSWQVLGDSCLFLLPEDGHLRCFCSMPVRVNPDWSLDVQFGNHPRQIHSDGAVVGEWIKGKRTITSGWVILASDAMSNWIVQQWNERRDFIPELWALHGQDDFEAFVEQEYQAGRLKSDDESVILIRIAEISDNSQTDEESVPTENSEFSQHFGNSDSSEDSEDSKSSDHYDHSEPSDDIESNTFDDDFDYSGFAQ